MKTIIIIAIIIVSTLSAVFIFSAIPSDMWKDQRTDFTGVSPPGELDEKIDCLSKGGVWDYTSCNFEEPEPEPTSEVEMNLRDAMQKLTEIYIPNSSFGPFNIRDVIVGYGIAGNVLVVDVLTEYYESDHLDLIKQKIRDIVGDKVTIEFSPSGAIIPTNNEPIISQNDLACFTVWKVQLNTSIDSKTLEGILRNKIAELGSIYDIPERDITIENVGDNRVKITIEGAWPVNEPNAHDLGKSIASIEVVDRVEDFIGGPVEGGCY